MLAFRMFKLRRVPVSFESADVKMFNLHVVEHVDEIQV